MSSSCEAERGVNPEWPARATIGFNFLCTPGMGVNLWGESPLYENQGCPLIQGMLPEVRAEGKGVSVRMGPKEARGCRAEAGVRKSIRETGTASPARGYPGLVSG